MLSGPRTRVVVACLVSLFVTAASAAPGTPEPPAAFRSLHPNSLAIAYPQFLWPKVGGVATVYYIVDPASDPNASAKIQAAIATFNADFPNVIQWVPWSSAFGPNYVDINLSAGDFSGQCEADEGYEARPAQPMSGSTACTVGTLLHEMGHVIGLWHEQSRSDRDTYVTVNYGNVIKGSWANFSINTDDEQVLGAYDYASVMQYIPFAFSRNGGPVIESIPAGIPLAGYSGIPAQAGAPGTAAQPPYDYSAGDKETIRRLYGAAPTQVTVTSNPVGLTVLVDGAPVITPQTFSWALNSTHTLDVPSGAQTLQGYILNSNPAVAATFYYTYGRWSDSTQQSHSIVVTPGNGSNVFPRTSPQVATYSANFVQLVPYAASVFPAAAGQVAVAPQPQAYSGVSGQFLIARQSATLTATPAAGFNFYEFNNAPFWLPGGLGANPKTFYVPDTGNPVNSTVEFSNTPVYTVNVQPNAFSSNLYAFVDNQFTYVPRNFSQFYDAGWSAGSSHILAVDPIEQPYSFNSRYQFSSWSDGGAISHTVASLPATATQYIATLAPQFQPATNFGFPPCGGSGALSPPSPTNDGFYPSGQQLSFSATPGTGWTFAGWTFDLSGLTNPAGLQATDETLVFANFNTTTAPLTLTAISPNSAAAGGAAFTMTLTGTGFTANTLVSVNGQFRTATFVSSTRLRVQVAATDIAQPTGFQVFVENFPTGSTGCAVFGYQTFLVTGALQVATPVIAPASGTYGSAQSVTITDATAGAVIRYTTNGKDPTATSTKYTGPITISTSKTVKAIGMKTGAANSAIATATYTIQATVATPVISPPGGTYSGAQTVTITDATTGAVIHYTTNGKTPTGTSAKYTGPITVSTSKTVKAIGTKTGATTSAVASATYTIH